MLLLSAVSSPQLGKITTYLLVQFSESRSISLIHKNIGYTFGEYQSLNNGKGKSNLFRVKYEFDQKICNKKLEVCRRIHEQDYVVQ